MKYKRDSRIWRSSTELDTESDANDYDPFLSDASVASRRSFGATCMFPDASETSDFESSRVPQPPPMPTGRQQSGATDKTERARDPYFFRTSQENPQKVEKTIEDALHRFKYYSKIKNFIRREDTNPRLTDHGMPSSVFMTYLPGSDQEAGKQSSLVTIFSIWNTIIGSSLLTMPWSMERAGLANGIFLVLVMGALCLYTAYLLLRVQQLHGGGHVDWEVSDLAGYLLGKRSALVAKLSSLVVLLGALIVYWILMSNFLFHSVDYLYERVNNFPGEHFNTSSSVLCLKNLTGLPESSLHVSEIVKRDVISDGDDHFSDSLYQHIWNVHTTVPIFLVIVIGPLVNFESATFFTKFNSLGTLSVLYLLTFVLIKGSSWGFNVDFYNPDSPLFTSNFNPSFPVLTGMLALALFIHNIIITIMRNNKHPEKNGRDLSIAFLLVVLTYLIVGVVFYVSFPLNKHCIEANLLDSFPNSDTLTVIARVFLFFQLVTVYPLIIYMLRIQWFATIMEKVYPRLPHILLFNAAVITTCILFAIFLPRIGTIIRFTGALSGFIYIFTLPSLLHLASLKKREKSTSCSTFFHVFVIVFGFANIVAQFFITER